MAGTMVLLYWAGVVELLATALSASQLIPPGLSINDPDCTMETLCELIGVNVDEAGGDSIVALDDVDWAQAAMCREMRETSRSAT